MVVILSRWSERLVWMPCAKSQTSILNPSLLQVSICRDTHVCISMLWAGKQNSVSPTYFAYVSLVLFWPSVALLVQSRPIPVVTNNVRFSISDVTAQTVNMHAAFWIGVWCEVNQFLTEILDQQLRISGIKLDHIAAVLSSVMVRSTFVPSCVQLICCGR